MTVMGSGVGSTCVCQNWISTCDKSCYLAISCCLHVLAELLYSCDCEWLLMIAVCAFG